MFTVAHPVSNCHLALRYPCQLSILPIRQLLSIPYSKSYSIHIHSVQLNPSASECEHPPGNGDRGTRVAQPPFTSTKLPIQLSGARYTYMLLLHYPKPESARRHKKARERRANTYPSTRSSSSKSQPSSSSTIRSSLLLTSLPLVPRAIARAGVAAVACSS